MKFDYSVDSILNPEQRRAVLSDHKRILCLAGAGSGKTATLTHRIARLWDMGVNPANILALSFTRAAGAEVKTRIIKLIGTEGKKLFSDTFHAWAVSIIRENAEHLGYESNFSIYDQNDAEELLKEVLGDLQYKIPAQKVMDFRAGKIMPLAIQKQAEQAAKEYDYRLRRNNAFDFDGLIGTLKRAIHDKSEILDDLHEWYKYVFVDEFQDTDPEQWSIIKFIDPENLFIVGDPSQSIYGFRGADAGIIMRLAENPDWQTIKLEQNYRSTIPIVNAANALIRHNQQIELSLFTDKKGLKVEYRESADDYAEIADIVGRLKTNQEDGMTTAILARTNRQIDNAAAILASLDVPHETNSSISNPLAGKDAKKLLAWIAAIENPQDDAVMRKIALMEMSKVAVLEVEKAQLSGSGSFYDALMETKDGREFLNNYENQAKNFESVDSITEKVFRISGLRIREDNDVLCEIDRWRQRQIDLGELATATALLEWVRMCNVSDKPEQVRDASRAYLMTVHGSKGLEFDDVFIIGATQGVFPNRGDIKEERRLFYVAMTRARGYLNISRPLVMADWSGHPKDTEKSQFVGEAIRE